MNNKQSSVKWLFCALIDQGYKNPHDMELISIIEQAKAMHREEHGKTWDESMDNFIARGENYVRAYVDFEDYYAETFGGNK